MNEEQKGENYWSAIYILQELLENGSREKQEIIDDLNLFDEEENDCGIN